MRASTTEGGTLPKQFSFRISETAFEFIRQEAQHEGVSVAQFVRESAWARVWFQRGIRGDYPEGLDAGVQLARDETQLDREKSFDDIKQ